MAPQITSESKLEFPQRKTDGKLLEFAHDLVQVLLDLGELGGELLVLEGVALLVEDLSHGGNQ